MARILGIIIIKEKVKHTTVFFVNWNVVRSFEVCETNTCEWNQIQRREQVIQDGSRSSRETEAQLYTQTLVASEAPLRR